MIIFTNYNSKKNFQSKYNKIKVITVDNYPPYVFRSDDGKIQGVVVDQWKEWEKATGIKVELQAMKPEEAINKIKNNDYDVIDAFFFSEEERESLYDFTKPYAIIEVPIFSQTNFKETKDVELLEGVSIAVRRGDRAIGALNANGISNIKEFDNYWTIINSAKDKSSFAFIMDKPVADYFIHKYKLDEKYNESKSLYTKELCRAVKKGNTQLLDTVDYGFSMISSWKYKEINAKWFGGYNLYKDYVHYLKFISLFFVIVMIFLVVWNITLKKMVRDKTAELIGALNKLKSSENKNKAIILAIPDLVFILNDEGVFLDSLSESNVKKLCLFPENFLGKSLNEVFTKDIADMFKNSINNLLQTGETQILEYQMKIRDEIYFFESRFIMCGNDNILSIIRDITKRKKSEKMIYEISMHDALTGLYNRNYFESKIKKYKKESLTNFGAVMCDVDGLKLVNDTLGHAEGDRYICIVADVLRSCFRKEDVIARIGGDEFAILMKKTSEEEVEKIKSDIQDLIDKLNSEENLIYISVSVGFSISTNRDNNLNKVFKEADEYMYREKLHHRHSAKSKNVEILMKMLKARDFITQGHGERIQELVSKLSEKVGMSKNQIKDVSLLAQFHDIGKVGIPDIVLFKSGKLSEEEMMIMKSHTEIGYRIAQASPDLRHISEWILKHHESWNGKGYPFGLTGEEIPLQCRILSIVDAYDAMTNDRPYRRAMTKEDAINELKHCSGEQFDPYLVGKFIELLE